MQLSEEDRFVAKNVVQVLSSGPDLSPMVPFAKPTPGQSRGSGFFIKADGHRGLILTCAHVVENAQPDVGVTVRLPSHGLRQFPVRVVAISSELDVAMLVMGDDAGLEPGEIPPGLPLGNDHDVAWGGELEAVGFPHGMDQVKTAKCRFNGIQDGGMQMDCPINHGHSGGPALADGRVVAYITSGLDPSASNSTSFAAPISHFLAVMPEFLKLAREGAHDCVVYPTTVGIAYHNTTDATKTPGCEGVTVFAVLKDSCVAGKVRPGDKLCSIEFESTHKPTGRHKYEIDYMGLVDVPWYAHSRLPLKYLVGEIGPNQAVDFNVWSASNKTSRVVHVAELTSPVPGGAYRMQVMQCEPLPYLVVGGLVLTPLRANHVMRMPLLGKIVAHPNEKEKERLFVAHVLPGSVAEAHEVLGRGDIITEINSREVKSVSDAIDAIKSADPVRITDRSGRMMQFTRQQLLDSDSQTTKMMEHESLAHQLGDANMIA